MLGQEISGRDLILLGGGLFLLAKSHARDPRASSKARRATAGAQVAPSFAGVIVQILLLDIVFSLDSVITAVGMADDVGGHDRGRRHRRRRDAVRPPGRSARFVDRHPTVKMLALSFLLLIGVSLIAEGFDQHIPKGYIYFAMALLGLRRDAQPARPREEPTPVHLHSPFESPKS